MVKSTHSFHPTRRAALSLFLACAMATGLSLFLASQRAAVTSARLDSAERELQALTDAQSEVLERSAIAWGYAERMRRGIESPFRLIEMASRDQRLTLDERRTVSWALLATLLRGESHQVDPAALDRVQRDSAVNGEAHLALVEAQIRRADDPRAAELALRLAYSLASAERAVDASAPPLIAQTAALVADGEIARREASHLLRATQDKNPIAAIVLARRKRDFYVERPVMLAPSRALESDAIAMVPALLAEIRALHAAPLLDGVPDSPMLLGQTLLSAASRAAPDAEIAVTMKRLLPSLRAKLPSALADRIERIRNSEMFVATLAEDRSRDQRRQLGRLQLAAAVATRSHAQDPVRMPDDSLLTAQQLGVASVSFDSDVPRAWRAGYVASFAAAIGNLEVVFPALELGGLHVRFRMKSPADSALAMHEPGSRTLHLPVGTAAGTLTHEIAHDLDRQIAIQQGRAGYWSDAANRSDAKARGSAVRVAASLRALTEEAAMSIAGKTATDRPAEIFATRVDWFVAQALARRGLSSGFLSAAQDEMLTGHVLHPERLRGAGRTRSLLTALEGMTTVAGFARAEPEPSAYSLMQLVLRSSVERTAVRGNRNLISLSAVACDDAPDGVAGLVRLAAESRARGIVRARAEAISPDRRPAWARAIMGEAPWSMAAADGRVDALTAELLGQLATPGLQQAGAGARIAAVLRDARCAE